MTWTAGFIGGMMLTVTLALLTVIAALQWRNRLL